VLTDYMSQFNSLRSATCESVGPTMAILANCAILLLPDSLRHFDSDATPKNENDREFRKQKSFAKGRAAMVRGQVTM